MANNWIEFKPLSSKWEIHNFTLHIILNILLKILKVYAGMEYRLGRKKIGFYTWNDIYTWFGGFLFHFFFFNPENSVFLTT